MAAKATGRKQTVELDELPQGGAERAEQAVRDAGALRLTAIIRDVIGAKLSRRGQAALVEVLERRGLERTANGFRVPVAEQLRHAIAEAGEFPLKGAKAELKRTALELVRRGEYVLAITDAGDVVAPPGERWMSASELATLKSALERVAKLIKKTAAKKGQPAATLERGSIQELLAFADGEQSMSREALVLAALGDLASARGRSVFVPELVLRVRKTAPATTAADVHAILLAAAERGELELRPESGVGLLSEQERALCVRSRDGTVLSYVRPRERARTPAV